MAIDHCLNICHRAQEPYIFSRPVFLINATIVLYLLLILIASLFLSINVTSAFVTSATFKYVSPFPYSRHLHESTY